MKRKTFLSVLTFALLGIILVSSCNKDSNVTYKATFATVIPVKGNLEPQKSSYLFISDDSLTLVPTNYSDFPNYEPKNNDRVLLYFQEVTSEPIEKSSYQPETKQIKVAGIENVLTKNIVYTDKIDTLGNAVALPQNIWYSGGIEEAKRFVTIEFVFFASSMSSSKHIVNLAQNLNEDTTKDGYYILEFKHNNNNQPYNDIRTYGYLSIPLNEEATAEGIKGLEIKFKTGDDTFKTIKVNY
jgi:hypothetical protein